MAAIDLIVLGMVKQQPMSAYDLQKQVEYRNISKWVRISTPSIYKKVLQLEEKGLLRSTPVKEGGMAEKAVYSLTAAGEVEFERLMLAVSSQPIRMFLDFNAVIVNLGSLPPEQQAACLAGIEANLTALKALLEENTARKAPLSEVPGTGKAVLRQQLGLVQALEDWLPSVKDVL